MHDVIQHIDNPKLFKAGVKQLYHSHCEAGSTANDMDRYLPAGCPRLSSRMRGEQVRARLRWRPMSLAVLLQ